MRRVLAAAFGLSAVILAGCQDTAPPVAPNAPSLSQGDTRAIPGRYIVVFNRDVTDAPGLARQLVLAHGGSLRHTYQHALKGFAGELSPAAAEALARHPRVAYVEQDQEMRISDTQNNPPSWGLDRIDQRDLPLSNSYTYANNGAGVTAYVLDTGIRFDHTDFGGRASLGTDQIGDGQNGNDCHGHGTHVAGTIGGSAHGVAKGVNLVAVRVLDCGGSGSTSGVIAGVDWVTANKVLPAVANMSLSGGANQSLDDAVTNSIAAGVVYALAAGNGNFFGRPISACSISPARTPNALTVGATQSNDAEASFSNYGTCVDILAPGVSITSAWSTSPTATNTISGTSMAAPHVAGAAALYLVANQGATPAQVGQALIDNASLNKISLHSRSRSNNTPNRLLYMGFIGGGGPPPPNNPPTASFTYSCNQLTCNFTDTSTDGDGTVVGWSWNFGDAGTSTAQNPSHTYAAGGTYTVQLTVTDDDGATGSTSSQVTVTAPGNISLQASGRQIFGVFKFVDLTWSGATGANVDVYRNGSLVTTTANDGSHSDFVGTASGTYTHRVCEAGTSNCSNTTSTTF